MVKRNIDFDSIEFDEAQLEQAERCIDEIPSLTGLAGPERYVVAEGIAKRIAALCIGLASGEPGAGRPFIVEVESAVHLKQFLVIYGDETDEEIRAHTKLVDEVDLLSWQLGRDTPPSAGAE